MKPTNTIAYRLRHGHTRNRSWLLLPLCLLWLQSMHGQTINSNATPVVSTVAGGSFETPTTPNYLYNPAPAGWTFLNHAGFAANNGGFTSGNNNAPQGLQVLFLQILGSASTSISIVTPGYYRFSCMAAQRMNQPPSAQTITVSIDNVPFDTIKPASTVAYQKYTTTAVYMTAGAHTLKMQGNMAIGDNTALVDDIKMERLASWSNAASWTGGVVPSLTTHNAVIDASEVMVLDVNTVNIKSLLVHGQLIAARDKNLSLSSEWIMADGASALLDWGTATAPYTLNALITLKGAYTGANINGWGVGEKFLAAHEGATIEMHGTNKLSWTQLEATAAVSATSITVKDPVNWLVGDKFVIASTDFRPELAEVRTITGISPNGKTISFSGGLSYMHYGALQTYKSGTLVLDERAEVGLLTRNIRIVGDNPGAAGFGGHCMFVHEAKVRFAGVEFNNMGQKGIKGRYPFHLHELGDITGMYIRNSSINVSFNRAVAVHTSSYGLIEDNVAYDHIGHGFYLEDAGAIRNMFRHNLGILTRRPLPALAVEPHDTLIENGLYSTPATFWVNNPNNDLVDNASAGSEGSGIWVLGRYQVALGITNDNRAHSNTFNYTIDGNLDDNGNMIYGHYRPAPGTIPVVNRLTSFKARERGIWIRGDSVLFDNCRLGDCPRNTFFAFNQRLRNSLVVGKSANTGTIVTANEATAGRSLARPQLLPTDELNIFFGHSLYDGPSGIENSHLAGFTGNNAFGFSIFAAAQKSTVHWAKGITFEAGTPEANKLKFDRYTDAEMMYASGLIDLDGSVTGTVNAVVMPKIVPNPLIPGKIHENGFNRRPAATERADWGAYVNTGTPFRLLRTDDYTLRLSDSVHISYPQYNIRSDGPASYGYPTVFRTVPSWHQNPVITNDNNYKYYWQRHTIPNRMEAVLHYANLNDYVISVFPNMPAYTTVYGSNVAGAPLTRLNSLAALQSSSVQAWYLADNTLYIKHIATIDAYLEMLTPNGHSKKSAPVNICLQPNCNPATQKQELDQVVFADLEQGADTRFTLTKTGTLGAISLAFDTGGTPTDGVDNKVSWNITKVGANNDSVDVRISVSRQIWTEFNHLRFKLTGANFQAIVHDANQGAKSLGTFAPGNAVIVPLNVAANSAYLDNVVGLTIRVRESDFGGGNGAIANMVLSHIALSINSTSAKTTGAEAEVPAAEPVITGASKGLQVYPNPASRQLTVTTGFEQADAVELQLVNATGKVMYTEQQRVPAGVFNHTLRLPQLPTGMYILNVKTLYHGTRTSRVTIVR